MNDKHLELDGVSIGALESVSLCVRPGEVVCLSGVALLRAVARRPHALLLDEPTANLDDATTQRVERWLGQLAAERGWPLVWVAHDAEQIRRVADRHYRIAGSGLERVE